MTIMNTSISNYSILETLSTQPDASADTAATLQLVQNSEDDFKLNGIEAVWGMRWGELRKWMNHPMNRMTLQPDLVELLRRKDVIISPTISLMAQIEEFLEYNMFHYRDPDHFLKRFPQKTYEYTVIPTTHTKSLFAQGGVLMENVKHSAPYNESLTFWSDAHPCFVLSFTVLDPVVRVWRPSTAILEQLPAGIVDCLTFVSCGPDPSFYCRPYPGWHP